MTTLNNQSVSIYSIKKQISTRQSVIAKICWELHFNPSMPPRAEQITENSFLIKFSYKGTPRVLHVELNGLTLTASTPKFGSYKEIISIVENLSV